MAYLITSIQYRPLTEDLNETAKAEVHKIIAARHGFDPKAKEAFEGMGHDQVEPDGGDDLYRDGYLSWGRGDCHAGTGRGGNYRTSCW